ncbi:MAG: MFS transporter [Betaproteobacteria bacterium]|nr:MFS transporter [Betaproteobacteria bacterium]
MKQFFAPYLAFMRLPDVALTLVMTWFARLPVGMTALSILLFMRESLGDFQQAGGLVGAYFIAIAVSAPLEGRIIDRRGPRGVLLVTGAVQPLAVLALFFATRHHLPYPALLAFAATAGLFSPPITILTRTVLRHRFHSDHERHMAFSIDAVFMELTFTVGPSLVALIVTLSNPQIAYLVTATAMAAATWIFLKSPALKYWKQEPPSERHFLGPLTDWRLVLQFALILGLTFCFGLMEVGYPAYAASLALPAFGGVLLTINSLGSAIGGALYGGLKLKLPPEQQFTWLLALIALPLALHGLVDAHLPFAIVAFLAGAAIAPAIAVQSILVSKIAPAKYATEAFTWSSTFIVCGLGMGMATGGAVAEQWSAKSPFLLGSVVAGLMALLSATAFFNSKKKSGRD